MDKIQFKTRKDVSAFLKEKNIDTTNWSEEKWQSINHSQTEIHMQALAEVMWDIYNESTPIQLKEGEWHIPFNEFMDDKEIYDVCLAPHNFDWNLGRIEVVKIQIATARCARLSYMTFEGNIDYISDITLFNQLLKSKHLSPFEHCAKVMSKLEYYSFVKGQVAAAEDEYGIINYETYPYSTGKDPMGWSGVNPKNMDNYGWCNNFKGFIPLRYMIEKKII